jgi:hypothetical protein
MNLHTQDFQESNRTPNRGGGPNAKYHLCGLPNNNPFRSQDNVVGINGI